VRSLSGVVSANRVNVSGWDEGECGSELGLQAFFWILEPLGRDSIDGPDTSVTNYHYSLRNNPEERSPRLLRGGSLESRFVTTSRHTLRLVFKRFGVLLLHDYVLSDVSVNVVEVRVYFRRHQHSRCTLRDSWTKYRNPNSDIRGSSMSDHLGVGIMS
jgi:hypothetical protein